MSSTVIRPRSSMSPDELCEELQIPRTQLNQWLRPRGIFHGVPREPGVYTTGDVVVGRVFLELQALLGERSERVAQYVTDLSPSLRAWVYSGTMPATFKVQVGNNGPVSVLIDLSHLGRQFAS
jgi:hypothetical protein